MRKFIKSHFYVSSWWGGDSWHIIPNVCIMYHEYGNALSFSLDFLKYNLWVQAQVKPFED